MDAEKTGLFIAELRGERGLTQRELAEKIGVTDKAVSKWERGRGFPDVAILETLSKELGVSVTELMSGERSTPETAAAQSDSAIVETLKYIKQMSRKTVGTLIIILGACILCSPLFTSGSFWLVVAGIIIAAKGILMLTPERSTPETVKEQSDSTLVETLKYIKQMNRKTIATLIIILGACILCSPLFTTGSIWLVVAGIIIAAKGILMLTSKRFFKPFVLPKIALEGISLVALAAAIFLEIWSDGAVLWLAPLMSVHIGAMSSYLQALPLELGTFPQLLTSLLTVAATIFTCIIMLIGKKFTKPQNALFVCIIVTVVFSVCAIVFSFDNFTLTSVLITLALVIAAAFRAAANTAKR